MICRIELDKYVCMYVQSGSFVGVKTFHVLVQETFEDVLPVIALFITLGQILVIFRIL